MKLENRLKRLKKSVYQANIKLYESGLITATFGNVSGIDRKSNTVAIKPSGISYNKLKVGDMVLISLDGKKISGVLNPSSDTKTHLIQYRSFPEIGGVTHTHSIYASAFAQAKLPIPCLGTTYADYFWGEVPVSRVIPDRCIKSDYELGTGKLIVDTFKTIDYCTMKACLVACYRPFTWGEDADESVDIAMALENITNLAYFSLSLNSSVSNIKKLCWINTI